MKDIYSLLTEQQAREIDKKLEKQGFREQGRSESKYPMRNAVWNRLRQLTCGEEVTAEARVFFSIASDEETTLASATLYLTKQEDGKPLQLVVHLENYEEITRYIIRFFGEDVAAKLLNT